jgi:predicted Fe-Mo cluster-binding NifX family protein
MFELAFTNTKPQQEAYFITNRSGMKLDIKSGMSILAITAWNGIISPVFDASGAFLFVRPDDKRELVAMQGAALTVKLDALKRNNADVVICGAISMLPLNWLNENRITVIPWICGSVDDVIRAYRTGSLQSPAFLMPGCGRGKCAGHKRRRLCGGKHTVKGAF